MAYAAASNVYALTPGLVKPASAFGAATCPTDTEVAIWLSSGCAIINARLAGAGYGAIPATSAAYDLAVAANALYGAWMAERSRINARVSADERTRADMFKRDFEFHLQQLLSLDLGRSGVTQTSRAYAGGISKSDKSTVEGNSDRVPSRFTRGAFRHNERLSPGSSDED